MSGFSLGEGPACTFWVFLRKYSLQLDDSSFRVAWTTGSQTPMEHHSRWPNYTFELLSLPLTHDSAPFSPSDILSTHSVKFSDIKKKKSPLSSWSLAHYISILIKNSMKSAWGWLFSDLLPAPSRTKSFFETALVVKQRHSGQLEVQHDSHLSPIMWLTISTHFYKRSFL